jgi:DNA replication licensing factor MCM2
VANPTDGRYDPQRTFAQNVNLSDPILSRFDVLCVLRDEADAAQDERLADHVLCSHIRSHPEATAEDKVVKPKLQQERTEVEPIPQDLLRKYIDYARRNVKPKVDNIDFQKLADFYQELRQESFRSGCAPMTARHVDSIVRMAEAFARMELRPHVTSRDLDNAIGMALESFIQSQKHQVAEELRKKYRKYVATPLSDLFMRIMDRLFQAKVQDWLLAHPEAGELVDWSQVFVSMEEVARIIEEEDLDDDEAHGFMASARFKNSFRLEGENLYRIV